MSLKILTSLSSHQSSWTFSYCSLLQVFQNRRNGGRGGHGNPDFDRSVNPVPTRGGGLCPPYYQNCPPEFSDFPMTLFFQPRRGFGHSREVDERSGRRFWKLWENPRQSHYKEVLRWEIFMEQELRFGLDLGRLALLKKKNIWANYELFLRPFFSSFRGKKNRDTSPWDYNDFNPKAGTEARDPSFMPQILTFSKKFSSKNRKPISIGQCLIAATMYRIWSCSKVIIIKYYLVPAIFLVKSQIP